MLALAACGRRLWPQAPRHRLQRLLSLPGLARGRVPEPDAAAELRRGLQHLRRVRHRALPAAGPLRAPAVRPRGRHEVRQPGPALSRQVGPHPLVRHARAGLRKPLCAGTSSSGPISKLDLSDAIFANAVDTGTVRLAELLLGARRADRPRPLVLPEHRHPSEHPVPPLAERADKVRRVPLRAWAFRPPSASARTRIPPERSSEACASPRSRWRRSSPRCRATTSRTPSAESG